MRYDLARLAACSMQRPLARVHSSANSPSLRAQGAAAEILQEFLDAVSVHEQSGSW